MKECSIGTYYLIQKHPVYKKVVAKILKKAGMKKN